jgi:hypothetical protein
MEDAYLSLVQEQKNFYDYLHFSPIKVCIIFELIPYLALYTAQTFQYWMEDAGLSLAQEKKNFYDYLHFSPIKVCNYFWTDTVFGLLYCTLTINILIPTGGCLFISGPGTKELLWLPTLHSYQGLYIFFEMIPYLTLYIAHIPQTF